MMTFEGMAARGVLPEKELLKAMESAKSAPGLMTSTVAVHGMMCGEDVESQRFG